MTATAFRCRSSPLTARLRRPGSRRGDRIPLIDGKPFKAWPSQAIIKFQMADAGTTHLFTMADGTVRQVKAVDFF
jgi:hypothetical protein